MEHNTRTHRWRRLLAIPAAATMIGFFSLPVATAQATTTTATPSGIVSQNVALVESADGGNGGTFPTSGFPNSYAPSFTDVSVSSIEDPTTNPLTGFDTVVFVQLGDIGTYLANSTFQSRIDSFVSGGGKLIIWDSETNPDYSNFIYPFTSDNPGAMGASGSTLNIVEQSTLSSSDPASSSYVDVTAVEAEDAVGDANVMTTYDPAWYVDMTASNTNHVTGPVQAYARYGNGLIIWNGLDMDPLSGMSTFDPASSDPDVQESRIWMLDLLQRFNPDNLPAEVKVFGVTLTPHTQQLLTGHQATLSALVTSATSPQADVEVTFNVTAGPNAGKTGSATTDSSGNAVFNWVGSAAGTDTVTVSASLSDSTNKQVTVSDTAYVTWTTETSGGEPSTNPSALAGYLMVGSDGGVFAYGGAGFYGSMGGKHLNGQMVGMVRTPTGNGYWLVAADGGVFSFGDAQFLGSAANLHLNAPMVNMVRTPTGNGYWLVAADGGVFAYGGAGFYGSMGGKHLNGAVVDIASTPDGNGYWLFAKDGGVFSFGDAQFFGSAAMDNLASPIVSAAATPDGNGYWLAAANGAVYAYGDAGPLGSMSHVPLNKPIVGFDNTQTGKGYVLAGADGGIFNFGDSTYAGNAVNLNLVGPIVHIADQ